MITSLMQIKIYSSTIYQDFQNILSIEQFYFTKNVPIKNFDRRLTQKLDVKILELLNRN